MARIDPQLKLRLPADLKDRVEKAAVDNHRSLNAEIVRRLEESFAPAAPPGTVREVTENLQKFLQSQVDIAVRKMMLDLKKNVSE